MERDDEHRRYYHDGKEIPSCTEIIKLLNKPELVGWANHMGFRRINTKTYLEEKAAFGTHCHKLFELYFSKTGFLYTKGHDDFLDKNHYDMVMYRFKILELFFERVGIEVVNLELPIEGSTYGGTLDMLVYNRKEDHLMILDLKTSKNVYDSHWMQLMGYAQLLKEVYDLPVEYVGIILLQRVNIDGMMNIRKTSDCQKELAIFNKLRDIYYLMNYNETEGGTTNEEISSSIYNDIGRLAFGGNRPK